MEIEEKKEITEMKYVKTGYKCDCCGKKYIGVKCPEDWHSFSSSHRAWGNDSIDSLSTFDVCSAKCYIKIIVTEIEHLHGETGAEINEMTISFAEKLVECFEGNKNIFY